MANGKKYLESSILTTAALVINKVIQFFFMAILTRKISQDAYGRYSIFQSWVNILSIIIGGSLSSSFGIAKSDFKEQYPGYLSSCVGLSYVLLGISFVLGFMVKGEWTAFYFVMVLLHSFNTNIMTNYDVMQTFYMRFKRAGFVSVSSSFVSAAFIIAAVSLFDADEGTAAIAALFTAYLFYSLYCQCAMLKDGHCVYNKKFWRYACRNSFWMIFHNLSLVVLNQMDRIMIGDMLSDSYAAIYSVIYGLSIVVSMLWGGAHKVWIPWMYQKMENKEYDTVAKVNGIMMIIMAILSINYCFVTPEIIKVFLPSSYWEGMDMMPAIVFGYFFSFIFSVYVNIVYVDKRMISITAGTIIAAAANIITNYIFIQLFGYKASAYTTLLAYFVLFLYHHILNYKKHYFVSKTLFALIGMLAVMMSVCRMLTYRPFARYSILIVIDAAIALTVKAHLKKFGCKITDLNKFLR